MPRVYYSNLDWLRVALASTVVIHHTLNQCWQAHGRAGPLWFAGVFPAVPAFLAISGFCIAGSWDAYPKVGRFFWKRALRILPALIAFFLLELLLAGPNATGRLALSWISAGIAAPSHLWSLGWEEIFYALFVATSAAGLLRGYWPSTLLLSGAYLILLFGQVGPALEPGLTVLVCFLAGVAYYRLRAVLCGRYLGKLPVLAFIASWTALIALGTVWPNDLAMRILTPALAFATLWLGTQGSQLRRPTWDLSYGVYIMGGLTIPIARFFADDGYLLTPMLSVAFALLLAGLSWNLIEAPALRFKHWRAQAQRTAEPPASVGADAAPVPAQSRVVAG